MKKLLFLLMLAPFFAQAQQVMPLSLKTSELIWSGRSLAGGGHTGTIQFLSGSLTTSNEGVVKKGEFVLDMKTIASTDIKDAEGAASLDDHLKSDDFFSVEKFPKAAFAILQVTPAFKFPGQDQYTITGLLTIKGITQTITFPATITKEKGTITAEAKISINRTKWDVMYQAESFLSTLKDGVIANEIVVTLKLKFGGC